MKISSIALATALVALAACGGKDDDSMSPRTSTNPAPPRTTTTPAAQDAIPSQQEYDSQATKKINAQNSDAEFEKLKKEIEGDG